MHFFDLNYDILYKIFDYCSLNDLTNLLHASELVENVLEEYLYKRIPDLLMCGTRNTPAIAERTIDSFTRTDRLRISNNWTDGRYHEYQYYNHKSVFSPKVHLELNNLYLTHAIFLRQYKRQYTNEPLDSQYETEIHCKSEINDFAKKGDTIFGGQICGSTFISENGIETEQRLHPASEYLQCVDFSNNIYVTSSDICTKIWQRNDEFGLVNLDLAHELRNSYKVMRLTDDGCRMYGGIKPNALRKVLREVNVATGQEQILNSESTSVYDIKLKDENIIFTANFDTTLRMYDRRTDRDEGIWKDPFESSLSCLEYDGLYGVLCGTKHHSRVDLFDIRIPKRYVQLYFPARHIDGYDNSPVYSIACDSRYLFVATDRNLRVFDYKINSISRDYKSIFNQYAYFRNYNF